MKRTTILRLSVLLLLSALLLTLCACDLFDKPSKETEPTTRPVTNAPTGNTTAGNPEGPESPSGENTTGKPEKPEQPTSGTVRIVYNGADGFDGATSFDSATGMTLASPTRTGYSFDGWYRSENFAGDPLTVIPGGETGTNGVLTLWAKWEPLTLTVNLRSGIPGQSQTRKRLTWGESMTLAAPTESYEGHTFAGWKLDNTLYSVGETFTFSDESLTSVTFVGEWTVNTCEVRFSADGKVTVEHLPYGSALTKTAEKTGYRFLGWSLDPNATEPTEGLTAGTEPMTVYAVFRIDTFALSVTVEANMDGVTVPGLTSGSYAFGTVLDLPEEITGYRLTYKVGNEGTVVGKKLTLTADTALTVCATPVKVTVRLAGDCAGMEDLDLDYGSLLIPQLPETSGTGLDIVGWYLNAEETDVLSYGARLTTVGSVTLWAKAADRRTCTFHYENGTTETVPLRFGSVLGKTDSKVGYSFAGWVDGNGNRVEAMSDRNIEVWSTFRINSYTLTFDVSPADDEGIGAEFAPITAEFGSKVTLPDGSELWYEYGTFAGWEYQGTVYNSFAEITVAAGDAVIRAKWDNTAIVIRFLDWDDTEIYRIETFKGKKFSIPHDSLIETAKEFDRWQFRNEIGQTCIFRDNETVFTDDTVVVAKYCKIWVDKNGVKQKADLVYPTADSFYFEVTSSKTLPDGTNVPTRYMISGQVVVDGSPTGAFIKQLPYDLCIPSTYNGALVTSMVKGMMNTKGAFATYVLDDKHQPNAIRFTSIFIPSAISHIPEYAFHGQYCDVTFGLDSKVTIISAYGMRASILGGGERCFYNFPEKLSTIGNYGFGVDEYKSRADWRWYRQDGTRITTLPESIKYIGQSAFSNLDLIESAHFGKNLERLGPSAFYSMMSLKTITIDPDCPLKAIPANCFNTTGLTSIVIPASVETIGSGAFQNCMSLSSVTFAEGSRLKRIENQAFYGYDNPLPITELRLPEGLEYIGKAAFSWHSGTSLGAIDGNFSYSSWHSAVAKNAIGPLKTLVLPSTLKEIGVCAFAYQSLEEIILPASLETIGDGAFYYCYNITAIDFTGLDNLKTIGGSAFMRPYDSKALTPFTVVIPKNLEVIGNYAFAGMTNLCDIHFTGDKLTEIGNGAFGDTGLKNYRLILPEGLKKIGSQAFYFTELVYVWFPGSLEEIGYQAFAGSETLTEIFFEENPDSEKGLVLRRDVFGGCKMLRSVTLPCQLVEMQGGILANQVDYNGVFAYCPELESVTFNGRDDGLADRNLILDTSVFYNCPKLKDVHIRRNTLIQLRMVRNDSVVNNVMFAGCDASLTVYVLPAMKAAYMRDQNGWSGIFVSGGRAKLTSEIV